MSRIPAQNTIDRISGCLSLHQRSLVCKGLLQLVQFQAHHVWESSGLAYKVSKNFVLKTFNCKVICSSDVLFLCKDLRFHRGYYHFLLKVLIITSDFARSVPIGMTKCQLTLILLDIIVTLPNYLTLVGFWQR